uniref:Putative secreted protein n=1 Tax=Ixodes ricinus TaxID=34613 RepID=A0A6B0U9F9_IXORI
MKRSREVCVLVLLLLSLFLFVRTERFQFTLVQTFVNQRQLQERQGAVSRDLTCLFFFSHRARNRTHHFLPRKYAQQIEMRGTRTWD